MSITVKQLNKNIASVRDVESIINEQLRIIDDKILRSDRAWGYNEIFHELPHNFNLLGLEKKDAQLIIYSSIIENLKQRGFNVKIELENNKSTLFISWIANINNSDFDKMRKVIASHMK